MTDKTMTLDVDDLAQEIRRVDGNHSLGACTLAEALMPFITRHLSQTAERGEAVELEYPEFHAEGMGCGLEDRVITDRYEAMRYGFDEALDQMARIIESAGPLYTAPPPAAGVPDARIIDLAERLVAAGPKAAHVSASECHEISEFILSLSATPSPATDVASVREVIFALDDKRLHFLSDKLARAIGDAHLSENGHG